MADLVYLEGREQIAKQTLDWLTDTIKVMLVSSLYTPDATGDSFYSDVSGNEISGTGYTTGGETLGTKAINVDTGNNQIEFDCADVTGWASGTFTGARYAIFYKDTGTPTTSPLICLHDFGADQDAPFDLIIDADGVWRWSV